MTMSCRKDLVSKKFGRLTVLKFIPDNSKYSQFLCQCDCGRIKIQKSFDLTSGNAKSCGCLNKELLSKRATTHGQAGKSRTGAYSSWACMMDRCHWGGNKDDYEKYGGAGIIVCERWHKFENFYADMGDRPEKTSIDRIDNLGNYEPSNCRWATSKMQNMNTSRNIKVKINNKIIFLKEYCADNNLNYVAIRAKAQRRGNDYVRALRSIGICCDYA